MSRTVLVLGTDHRYQTRATDFSEAQHASFMRFVTEVCQTHRIRAIAEEFNTQALEEAGIRESVPQGIARNLDLEHRYCDPNRETRAQLGILQENDIRVQAFIQGLHETVIHKQLQASLWTRRRYWIPQIIDLNVWPVLFICGADHSVPLLSLLPEHDLRGELIARDWSG